MTVPLEYVGIPYTTWEAEGQMSIFDLIKGVRTEDKTGENER